MSLGVKKTTGEQYDPVFLKILEKIDAGGTLKTDRVPSTVKEIKAGTIIAESSSTAGLFNIVKTGKVLAAVTTTTAVTVYVRSSNFFKAGEFVAKSGGSNGVTISSISRSGGTDTIVLALNLGTLTTLSVLYESTSAASTASKFSATAILGDTVAVRRDDLSTLPNVTISAVVRGTVDESVLPNPVKPADKTNLTARIRFA